ncbi:hypothetical protein N9245_00430 [bacterium]|nr:hypothetical protein [bacterium]
MASKDLYKFVTNYHSLYARYEDAWRLNVKSYWGGPEYKHGQYLKMYATDSSTPSDIIRTQEVTGDGTPTGKYTSVAIANSPSEAENPDYMLNNFYGEKLDQVAVYPYTRLYVSEYNAMLMRSSPSRVLPDTPEVEAFSKDCDGQGNSLNEFWSMVDIYTTVYGVVWVSCIKYGDADYPLWRWHSPLDVTNWQYKYNNKGELILKEIVIKLSDEPEVDIYQHITDETITTIYVPQTEEFSVENLPEEAEYYDDEGDQDSGYYQIIQENTLGELFVRPVYQSNKIYNGVGHTNIFDIAQIQRSIYSLSADAYSAFTYGSHPVNIIDSETADMNDGAISAEPGAVIRVNASLTGNPSYVYEFVAPPLDSISEIRAYINQNIEKMNEVAMVRSDDLIKASRSGAQIEQMDSKLEAFVRRKAISLENAEYQMWKLWFDWMDQEMPEDLSISYSRVYTQKGLEQEISEMNQLMGLLDEYSNRYMAGTTTFVAEKFATQEQAEARALELGGSGSHSHTEEDGTIIYMPFSSHADYERILEEQNPGVDYEEDTGFEKEIKEKLRARMKQLIDGSYSSNSL